MIAIDALPERSLTTRPHSPFLSFEVDRDILPLVLALNADDVVTVSSCSGHGYESASIVMLVRGVDGLRSLRRAMNAAFRAARRRVRFEVALGWHEEIVVAALSDVWPDWVAVVWDLSSRSTCVTPSPGQIRAVAEAVTRTLPGSGRPPRISRQTRKKVSSVDVDVRIAGDLR